MGWQGAMPATDKTGERDYGSIDALRLIDDTWIIEGDFGQIVVASALPVVCLTARPGVPH